MSITELPGRLIAKLRQDGPIATLRAATVFGLTRLTLAAFGTDGDFTGLRRLELGRELSARFSNTVAYGPLKGFKLTPSMSWGAADRAGMLLGLYEQEILQTLESIPARYTTFIDLGAADGYYGVGVLVNKRFTKSYCFEMSEAGRAVIRENAVANGVSDRVEVFGFADADFYTKLPAAEIARAVLVVDIEGGEFDLLSAPVLEAFRESVIIIELHDRLVDDGAARLAQLKERASRHFRITEMTMGARDPSVFPELRDYNDGDRWLICSEGRPFLMSWLRLDPLAPSAA